MATFLDYFNTSMQNHVLGSIVDQVSKGNVLANLAIRKASYIDGGSFIAQPVYIQLPTSAVKAYRGVVTFPDNTLELEASMVFQICFYGVNIELMGTDLALNKGLKQTVNLIRSRMAGGEIAMRQRFGSDIFGDGTTDGGNSFIGLAAAIDDGSLYDNYGGFSRAAYPVIKSNVLSNGTNRALTPSLIDTADQEAKIGTDRSSLHVTTPGCVTRLASYIQSTQRAVQGDIGSWGFRNIAWHGYPVLADDFCPTSPGEFYYLLNPRFLQMWFLSGRFFQWIPFYHIPKTDTYCSNIFTACAFLCSSPRMQAVIRNLNSAL